MYMCSYGHVCMCCMYMYDDQPADSRPLHSQEEFDRYTGFWWQPKQRKQSEFDDSLFLLYEEVSTM